MLYRNTFGTQPRKPLGPLQNAFDLYLKNPANTNVVLWGNRLLALWEVCSQAPRPPFGTMSTIWHHATIWHQLCCRLHC